MQIAYDISVAEPTSGLIVVVAALAEYSGSGLECAQKTSLASDGCFVTASSTTVNPTYNVLYLQRNETRSLTQLGKSGISLTALIMLYFIKQYTCSLQPTLLNTSICWLDALRTLSIGYPFFHTFLETWNIYHSFVVQKYSSFGEFDKYGLVVMLLCKSSSIITVPRGQKCNCFKNSVILRLQKIKKVGTCKFLSKSQLTSKSSSSSPKGFSNASATFNQPT